MYGNHQQSPAINHDAYIQALGNIASFTIWKIHDDGQTLFDPVIVTGPSLIPLLVINEHTLRYEVDRIAAEQGHWGRMRAQCGRVVAIRAREYRRWKAQQEMDLRRVHRDAGEKPPSKELIEATYRTNAGYDAVAIALEAAEESHSCADIAYNAFRAKKDVLESDIWRAADGSLQRRSI